MSEHVSQPGRRSFLSWVAAGFGGLAAVAVGLPFVGYLLGPLLRNNEEELKKKGEDQVRLGKVSDFPTGETRSVTFTNPLRQPWDGMAAHTNVFVCRLTKDGDTKPQFRVLAQNCAHLGCPVTFFPQSKLFMCPCHGGVYYETGERASGPPPRGLFPCVWEVKEGQLVIQAPHLPTLQDTLDKPA